MALACIVITVFLWKDKIQSLNQISLKYARNYKTTTETKELKIKGQEKLIVLYTDFFTGPWYLRWNKNYPCAFNCKFTYNKSAIETADAVGFHDADLPLVFPKRTKEDQIWFYLNLESPVFSKAKEYRNIFNWTMSYRTDSDVFAPYGNYEPLSCSQAVLAKKKWGLRDFAANKTKMVAWVCSNCHDVGGRMDYAKKLAGYINVNIYGKCGKFDCSRGTTARFSDDCKSKLKEYKFYLALENSICYDYVTEKYWQNALENDLVPIVMGGADYNRIGIPGSYINVKDFKTVKKLADYLSYLDQNHTAYNEYFQWKTMFKLSTPYTYGCTLCSALHSNKATQFKVIPSLHQFWKENKCKLGKVAVK